MEISKTLQPGDMGTKRFLNKYGDQLVCVRYRIDKQLQKRYTAIELIFGANGDTYVFGMRNGLQGSNWSGNGFGGLAVFSGDVEPVPLLAAVWLFGSGLLGLIGVARRKVWD